MGSFRWLSLLVLAAAVGLAGCADRAHTAPTPRQVDGEDLVGPMPEDELPSTADPSPRSWAPDIELTRIVHGLDKPTSVTSAGDGSERLFVLEKPGRVLVIEDDQLREEPYLNLTDRVAFGHERGLLGLAFDPSFAENGRLYVSYTDQEGDSVLARHTIEDPGQGSPSRDEIVLTVDQPHPIHNGGHVAFGPDGYLYYAIGDGGPAEGDPDDHGQNPDTLLASMLRLDVSGEEVQAPADNPFAGDEEGHELVWAYGLRNPWRFSFDRETGDLYIGDVGTGTMEEVNRQPADSDGGENYGWNRWEGYATFNGTPDREGFTFPVLQYAHEEGRCAVTGGYVYRGQAIDALQDRYVFGDFCTGEIWAAENVSAGWRWAVMLDTELRITSFGEDADGELYVVDYGGTVHRIVEP